MSNHYLNLRAKYLTHLEAAKSIAAKAETEGRDFTAEERREVDMHLSETKAIEPALRQAKADAAVRETLAGIGGPAGVTGGGGYAIGASGWAKAVASKLAKTAGAYGVKAISAGGIDVPAVVEPTVTLPSLPTRLLDLVPARPIGGNEYAYPKQTARTSNADTVADGALKPTSTYSFEEVTDRSRVVAHLSESLPLRLFADHSDLESVLDSQMRDDLLLKIEGLVVAGDGTGEDWTGVLNTSGVQAQAYATNVVTTMRKARTKLDVLGETPTAWALNPTDIETLDLLQDAQDRYYGAELAGLLGNLPRVPCTSVPVGSAVLGDWRMARLFVREQAALTVDASGPLFDRNQCKIRCEMRAGFGVLRPQAFVIVDLTP